MPPKRSRFAADDDEVEEYLSGSPLSHDTVAREHVDLQDPIFMSLDYHAKGILSPKSRDHTSPVRRSQIPAIATALA